MSLNNSMQILSIAGFAISMGFSRLSLQNHDKEYKDLRLQMQQGLYEETRTPLADRMLSRPWLYGLKININDSSTLALLDIPGIGPTLSKRLIEHREIHGEYKNETDLDNVKGIGPFTLRKIRPHIRFE